MFPFTIIIPFISLETEKVFCFFRFKSLLEILKVVTY